MNQSVNESINLSIDQSFLAIRHIKAVFNHKSYAIFRRVLRYIRQSIGQSFLDFQPFVRSADFKKMHFIPTDWQMDEYTKKSLCPKTRFLGHPIIFDIVVNLECLMIFVLNQRSIILFNICNYWKTICTINYWRSLKNVVWEKDTFFRDT